MRFVMYKNRKTEMKVVKKKSVNKEERSDTYLTRMQIGMEHREI